jgi:hypothetical protein
MDSGMDSGMRQLINHCTKRRERDVTQTGWQEQSALSLIPFTIILPINNLVL